MQMTSRITYLDNLRTKCTHLKSGDTFFTDAPVDNKGKGEAFSPTDLCATSLASCILTIMGIVAETHQINMRGAEAELQKTMASDPRRISQIDIHLSMPKDESYSEKQKMILERAADHCPVHMSLHSDLKINTTIAWPTAES